MVLTPPFYCDHGDKIYFGKHFYANTGLTILDENVVYLDSENWMKASIEYENEQYQRLGSVVTNHGYSDWATTDIDALVKSMWYRLSH